LVSAICKVRSNRQLVECVKRWALKVPVPQHPVPESFCYRPVTIAADLYRLALRYQNCLRQYLVHALNGDHAFAEVSLDPGKRGLMVHLQRGNSKWLVQGLFGFQNAPPRPELRRSALEHLRAHGIEERRRVRLPEGPWSALTRLTSSPFYDVDY
jgi:hypothetical protein